MEQTPASLSIKRLGVFLGAEVTGVDLARPLEPEAAEAIRRAHAEHGVLVLPDQKLGKEDLKRFGCHFGPLSVHPFSTSDPGDPELIVFDNKEGNPPAPTDVWHSDETFREAPPVATALYSRIVPEAGGDTALASMSAVYEGLSERWQRFLTGLEAVHDFKPFRGLFPDDRAGIERLRKYEDMYPPVTHPVVAVHPVTGKKVIFVNPQFTLHIRGMAEDESRMILEMLYRRTLVHEYHYRHR
jgi:taurine dioxygenase